MVISPSEEQVLPVHRGTPATLELPTGRVGVGGGPGWGAGVPCVVGRCVGGVDVGGVTSPVVVVVGPGEFSVSEPAHRSPPFKGAKPRFRSLCGRPPLHSACMPAKVEMTDREANPWGGGRGPRVPGGLGGGRRVAGWTMGGKQSQARRCCPMVGRTETRRLNQLTQYLVRTLI